MDGNAEYDSLDLLNRDAEERYFDDEEPQSEDSNPPIEKLQLDSNLCDASMKVFLPDSKSKEEADSQEVHSDHG